MTLNGSKEQLTLATKQISLTIDRTSGLVTRYSRNGEVVLTGGAPNFYRALTDNDIGTGLEKSHGIWNAVSNARTVSSVVARRVNRSAAEVTVTNDLGDRIARFVTRYQMNGDGSVEVTGTFTPLKTG